MILEEGKYYVTKDESQVRGPMRKDTRYTTYQWTDEIYHWDEAGRSMFLQDTWRDLAREATKAERRWTIARSWLNGAQAD